MRTRTSRPAWAGPALAVSVLAQACGSPSPLATEGEAGGFYAASPPFRVKDITPGPDSSFPFSGVEFEGALFFTAGGTSRRSLWRSDGTEAGTFLVKTIPGPGLADVRDLAVVDGRLLFTVSGTGDQLWSSDGTSAGTVPVKDFPRYSYLSRLRVVGGRLFFMATCCSVTGPRTATLWRSDGSALGTIPLVEFRSLDYFGSPGFRWMAAARDILFFTAYDPTQGTELWTSDGTASGTRLVQDILPGPNLDGPEFLTPLGDAVVFFPHFAADRTELWRSDGTPRGTGQVLRLGPRSVPEPCAARQRLFFAGNDGRHGEELWISDGTGPGTRMVKDINPDRSAYPLSLACLPRATFFTADDGRHGAELWMSDGTEEGTRMVKDIVPGRDASLPDSLLDGRGRLFFLADDGTHGRELWTSDGTEEGTVLLQDIAPGPRSSGLRWIGATSSFAFFVATEGTGGTELWAVPLR